MEDNHILLSMLGSKSKRWLRNLPWLKTCCVYDPMQWRHARCKTHCDASCTPMLANFVPSNPGLQAQAKGEVAQVSGCYSFYPAVCGYLPSQPH